MRFGNWIGLSLGIGLLAAAGARPAAGQPAPGAVPGAQPAPSVQAPPAPPPTPAAPPYEQDLLRLAEVLGALQHLRPLCGKDEGNRWREQMQALLDAEATSQDRKERFAGAYNASLKTYRRSYSTCTPAAELLIRRFLGEGARIAREVAARYGN